MSTQLSVQRTTSSKIRARKGGEPIVCLTAYSAPIARALDSHVDVLLVGDSLAMVVYGEPNTLSISLDTMILHAKAVVSNSSQPLIVVDMPFGSYEANAETAFASAVRILKETGAQAVKLEGGRLMAPTIAFLTARGIPIMAHIGLQPQAVRQKGYRIAGRDQADAQRLLDDAKAVEAAGAFAVVIEGTIEAVAAEITATLTIPTIGIGASSRCDGQILVIDDLLGLTVTGRTPSFVKRYADLDRLVADAAKAYAADVRARKFPGPDHVFEK
ncbi:MAG TPA: 3-methyl-2-oxobutanoate hydroxymethyltransferase [Alphaproteobacteria bacterium]|nr:3-methyl-2-oxobutanoate hydroxymethyltransferase [Alphaproteobacteria bacterium]